MSLVWIGIAAFGLCPVLMLVSAVGSALIRRRFPPRGRFVDIRGQRLHHDETEAVADDTGPPVVVIHGASGNLEEARLGLGQALAGRRVIYLDRPGHGHSGRGGPEMSAPASQAGVIVDLLDRLGIARSVVVGHSWGASVAVAMAVLHPDRVAGLVLVAPATHPWPGGVAWYHRVLRRPVLGRLFAWTLPLPIGLVVMGPAVRAVFEPQPAPDDYARCAHIPLLLQPNVFRANSMDIHDLNANVAALAPRYGEIRAPTVVLTGDADKVVAPWIHSDGLVRDIPGAELVTLAGVGHMPHHSSADAVADAVARVSRRAMAEI